MQHSISKTLFYRLRKVGNSLTRLQSHFYYLDKCNNNVFINKGFLRSSNVTYEDSYHTCQQKQDRASLEIQEEVTSWLEIKIKLIKKDFICKKDAKRTLHSGILASTS